MIWCALWCLCVLYSTIIADDVTRSLFKLIRRARADLFSFHSIASTALLFYSYRSRVSTLYTHEYYIIITIRLCRTPSPYSVRRECFFSYIYIFLIVTVYTRLYYYYRLILYYYICLLFESVSRRSNCCCSAYIRLRTAPINYIVGQRNENVTFNVIYDNRDEDVSVYSVCVHDINSFIILYGLVRRQKNENTSA